MPGLVREEGEGCGFFGFGGEAGGVDGGDGAVVWGEAVADLGEEGRIARASAGDDDVDGGVGGEGKDPAANGVGDTGGGEGSSGGDGVFRVLAVFAAGGEEF